MVEKFYDNRNFEILKINKKKRKYLYVDHCVMYIATIDIFFKD